MKLKNFDKMIQNLINDFNELDDIQVVCDYEIMNILKEKCMNDLEIQCEEIDENIDEYIIGKTKNENNYEYFIESLKNNDIIKYSCCNDFIIQEYILKNNKGLLGYLRPVYENKIFNIKII